jgi:hypothetical protein
MKSRFHRALSGVFILALLLAFASRAEAYTRADIGKYDWGWAPIGQLAEKVKYGDIALGAMEARFKYAYLEQGNYLRSNFSSGFGVGVPVTLVRSVRSLWTVRFYQFFHGTWGDSLLMPYRARLAILDPRAWYADPLYLIAGSIERKYMEVGATATLGGPEGPQFKTSDGFVDQRFERGEIGFRNVNDPWWHRWNEGWHR